MEPTKIQRYHEISVTVPSDDVEPVANYIIENIAGGLLLEDEEGDLHTTIKFYVANGVDVAAHLDGLKRYLVAVNPALADVALRQRNISNLDWIEAYRESVTPVVIGETIVVKPPWNTDPFPGKVEIIIEPKMAFGTGRHESTRGSLAEMEKLDLSGRSILDLGCGSGILGIYAARRGAAEVLGYDVDALAVENSTENFDINGVASVCRARIGSIDDVPEGRRFDVILVNIIKSVIVPIVGKLAGHLYPGGVLILAGLLDQDRQDIEAELMRHGLTSFSTRLENEWVTYTVYRT